MENALYLTYLRALCNNHLKLTESTLNKRHLGHAKSSRCFRKDKIFQKRTKFNQLGHYQVLNSRTRGIRLKSSSPLWIFFPIPADAPSVEVSIKEMADAKRLYHICLVNSP